MVAIAEGSAVGRMVNLKHEARSSEGERSELDLRVLALHLETGSCSPP